MRLRSFPLFLALAAGACGIRHHGRGQGKTRFPPKSKPRATPKAEPKAVAGKTEEKEAEAAVAESGARFVAAYNRHDAKAIAAGFTATAEFVTEDGTTIRGREAIEQHFVAVFSEFPKAQLQLHVDAVRLVTSTVAIEEGDVEVQGHPGRTAERIATSPSIFTRRVRCARRTVTFPPKPKSARTTNICANWNGWSVNEQEGEASLITTSCKWVDRKNFLLQEFTLRIGNGDPITGSTRIGWDPQTQQIKSWTLTPTGATSIALNVGR